MAGLVPRNLIHLSCAPRLSLRLLAAVLFQGQTPLVRSPAVLPGGPGMRLQPPTPIATAPLQVRMAGTQSGLPDPGSPPGHPPHEGQGLLLSPAPRPHLCLWNTWLGDVRYGPAFCRPPVQHFSCDPETSEILKSHLLLSFSRTAESTDFLRFHGSILDRGSSPPFTE